MVSNSDLEIWQQAVNGINVSGKTDLSKEEWSALTVLNSSLTNDNFQSNESRYSIKFLKDNLITHDNNPVLQMNLQNFITLIEKYNTGTDSVPVPALNIPGLPINPSGKSSEDARKGSVSMRAIIIIAVLLLAGYALLKNKGGSNGDFSGRSSNLYGVYVPKNDIAEASYYTKFEFKGGNRVKVYVGTFGISGIAYELTYSLNGNSLSISEAGRNESVELTYDKIKDEISFPDAFGTEGAVWGKE